MVTGSEISSNACRKIWDVRMVEEGAGFFESLSLGSVDSMAARTGANGF